MLNQPTIEKLHTMKLHGMADAFRAQIETADASQLGFEERFGMLVDQQWLWKENRALARRLQSARLKERGVIEDIDYQHPRGLDRKLLRTLSASEWVRQNQNVLLIGRTDPVTFSPLTTSLKISTLKIPNPVRDACHSDHRNLYPRSIHWRCWVIGRPIIFKVMPQATFTTFSARATRITSAMQTSFVSICHGREQLVWPGKPYAR